MTHPSGVMTFSDSGAHVSQICGPSIQTFLLAYWVRERQALTLENAMRMLTAVAAASWDLTDRRLPRQGRATDLNVLDPSRIAPNLPEVAFDLPSGSKRFVQKATGISATVVRVQITRCNGQPTGARCGLLGRPASPS
jgi:N-acyl-D-amino-acid deacylase